MTLSLRQVEQARERRELKEYLAREQESSRVTIGDLFGSMLAESQVTRQQEEGEAAEDTPAEEAVTEELAAEEAPVEEGVTEEAPVEEGVTEEAPVEEGVTEEAPVEEGATEEAPVEEGVTEELTPETGEEPESAAAEERPGRPVGE